MQNSGHRSYIRPTGDHQAGGGVPQAVDVQVQGQVVLFENQLEPPGESAGVHGQVGTVTAENIILWGERASSWSSISPLQKERYSFKRLAISREK